MLKYSQTPGIFKLEGNRLGRPYHRLPTMFTGNFDTIESHLGNYFLKKHRTNITLKRIHCEMDVINKSADLLVSQVGHLAFDIDRSLLLMLLGNFYGLESSLADKNLQDDLPTKTETRLKSRLALDISSIIFDKNTSGIPLTLKLDSSTVQTHWAYQLTFTLGDNEDCSFRVLLDDAHTDYILNLIRRNEHGKSKQQVDKTTTSLQKKTLIKEIINTLPLTLSVKIAELPLNVADLTTIKPGDILPITMPDSFPVYIGKSELFNALIVEDKDRLFLSELANI
ncbi:FliM/FliN family flagellar motor switch protein [Citrobacter sp. S2-9]|uniref:FliM/FliN family flagellar motor switch protein n=1 Tax=Citrobacter enshiensis TaxID=2971264 RepID=A0ABT8PQB2_9ENTR|nr:FliM/FliN family flagellar motor switch protein [Citrobacter enshiensis]MDN8598438.1 FliM/FliN family flagellar motor switch protein [Citrobacter enshiensis]